MRLKTVPESLLERVVMALGVVPIPLVETMGAFILAQTIMTGVKAGVFDALASGPATAAEAAAKCGTNPNATSKLMGALAGSGYLKFAHGKFELTSQSRKWLLKDSPESLRDKMLFQFLEYDFVGKFSDYVRTGEPLSIHQEQNEEMWNLYQRGMRSLAGSSGAEIGKRTPIPPGARDMLDIGGSHGHYSSCICRNHPELRSTILDLPEAIKQAAPLLAKEQMGDRVVHRPGNALIDDIGNAAWDVVYIAQLLHHFGEPENRALSKKVAEALRPGGLFIIQEGIRPRTPDEAGQLGGLLDLYFAATSQSGTWSIDEMTDWQRSAGLEPQPVVRLRSVPGVAQVVAKKPN